MRHDSRSRLLPAFLDEPVCRVVDKRRDTAEPIGLPDLIADEVVGIRRCLAKRIGLRDEPAPAVVGIAGDVARGVGHARGAADRVVGCHRRKPAGVGHRCATVELVVDIGRHEPERVGDRGEVANRIVGETGDGPGHAHRRRGSRRRDLAAEVIEGNIGRSPERIGGRGHAAAGIVGLTDDVAGHGCWQGIGDGANRPVWAEGIDRGDGTAEGVVEDPGREARVAGSRAARIGREAEIAGSVVAVVGRGPPLACVRGERADLSTKRVVDGVGPPAKLVDHGRHAARYVVFHAGCVQRIAGNDAQSVGLRGHSPEGVELPPGGAAERVGGGDEVTCSVVDEPDDGRLRGGVGPRTAGGDLPVHRVVDIERPAAQAVDRDHGIARSVEDGGLRSSRSVRHRQGMADLVIRKTRAAAERIGRRR